MGVVLDLGILGVPPSLIDHVKLEAGDGIELEYNYPNNSIVIAVIAPPKSNPGELDPSVLGTFDFDSVIADFSKILRIAGNVYAIAYRGADAHGWVKTVAINNDGTFGPAVIDAYEWDGNVTGSYLDFIRVGPERYAIAYQKADLTGSLISLAILNDGTIAQFVISTFEIDGNRGQSFSMLQISEDVFAIIYSGEDTKGWIKTFTIEDNGFINEEIDAFWYDSSYAATPDLIHIADHHFAVVYRGPGLDGTLATLIIDEDGTITHAVTEKVVFDPGMGYTPKIVHVAGETYAIAYQGTGNDGWLITISIDNDGGLGGGILDFYKYEEVLSTAPALIFRGEDVYAIAFRGPNQHGWIKSFRIANDGSITQPYIDSLEFNNNNIAFPYMIQISGDTYAIAFSRTGAAGTLTTVGIDP